MRTRKNENRTDWQFTTEHIGRELRKLYPPKGLPPNWRALLGSSVQDLGRCTKFEQMAAKEKDAKLKEHFEKQGAAYRKLAEIKSKGLRPPRSQRAAP